MKKMLICILFVSFMLLTASAEELPSLSALTGLDQMPEDAEVTLAEYDTGTKLERGFTTEDPEEIRSLLDAVNAMTVAGTTDEFVTDMYPSLRFYFSDGTCCSLCFDGKWLEKDGKNYILENDAPFWKLIAGMLERYADAPERPFQPNCTDIYLPSNPTTGYSWQFAVDLPDVVSVAEQYFPDAAEPGMTGVGGNHWFHFDGLHPGVAAVTLTYARPWEGEAEQTLVFRLSVDEQLNVLIWGVEMSGR